MLHTMPFRLRLVHPQATPRTTTSGSRRSWSLRAPLRVSLRVTLGLGVVWAAGACTLPAVDTPADSSQQATTAEGPSSNPAPGAAAVASNASTTARDRCDIRSVSDGDSLRCTDGRRIRLLLLDAPEMSQTPFGTRSRDALRARLPRGATIWLEYDVQRLDRYDRTLAYLWTEPTGGELINVSHARDGWAVAVVFPPNVRRIAEVRRAVADARRMRRGLWSDDAFTCEPIEHKRGNC